MVIITCILALGMIYLGYKLRQAKLIASGLSKMLESRDITIAEQKKLISGQGLFIQKYTDELVKRKDLREKNTLNSKLSATSFDLANMLGEIGRVQRFTQ